MDDRNLPRTRNTAPALLPETRRRVDEVVLSAGGMLYYRLSPGATRPTELVDDRGRTVLEAFGALPMKQMSEDSDAYRVSMRGVEGAALDDAHVLNLIGPLVAFVRTFGPIGLDWSGQFGVRNPEVERLERDLEQMRLARMGIDPATTRIGRGADLIAGRRASGVMGPAETLFPSFVDVSPTRVGRGLSGSVLRMTESPMTSGHRSSTSIRT